MSVEAINEQNTYECLHMSIEASNEKKKKPRIDVHKCQLKQTMNKTHINIATKSKTEVPRDVETQKSGNTTSSRKIGLNIRTLASPQVYGQPF